jgi:hypothetical protein
LRGREEFRANPPARRNCKFNGFYFVKPRVNLNGTFDGTCFRTWDNHVLQLSQLAPEHVLFGCRSSVSSNKRAVGNHILFTRKSTPTFARFQILLQIYSGATANRRCAPHRPQHCPPTTSTNIPTARPQHAAIKRGHTCGLFSISNV